MKIAIYDQNHRWAGERAKEFRENDPWKPDDIVVYKGSKHELRKIAKSLLNSAISESIAGNNADVPYKLTCARTIFKALSGKRR